MKFITTRSEDNIEEIFVFPRHINHDCMAEVLSRIRNQMHGNWERIYREPIAAGFVSARMECYGRSETLNLAARKEDTELMRKELP